MFDSAAQDLQVPSGNAVIYVLSKFKGYAATLTPLFVKYLKKLSLARSSTKKAFLAKHWIIHIMARRTT